jgi:hypothetical protein
VTHLEYALAYAAIGWHVFPLLKGTKHPNGKLARQGHLDATTDIEKITAWWTADPEAGIGVAMQASRLVTVDVDPRNGGHFDLERIEAEHGKLDTAVEALTGGGGGHLVFLAPSDIGRLPGKLSKGIDLKADGYIVVEPSVHPSGRTYVWEASSNPLEGNVPAPLPGWIADMSRAAPSVVPAGPVPGVRALSEIELSDIRGALTMIPADEREAWLYVGMALHKDVGGALGYELWSTWSQSCPAKFDPQDQLRVWRSFTRKPMGEAVQLGTIFDLAYKHGFSRPKVPPALVLVPPAPGKPDPRTMNTVPEIVDGPRVQTQAMPVQGLNDLARWIFDTAPNAHALLAQAAALALVCTCAGRRYVSEFGDPATAYFGLLTPTTSQARPMLTAAESALIDINLRRLVRSQRMGSAQQVYASFVRSSSVLYAADDWGDQIASAKRQPSGLLSIAHGVLAGRVHSAKDIALDNWAEIGLKRPDGQTSHMPTLYRPGLTLLAAIAEPQLRTAFKRQEFGRGALDCMLFVPALDMAGWADRSVAAQTSLPPAVAARLRELRGLSPDSAELPEPEIDSALIRPTPITARFACDLAGAEARWIEHGRKLPKHLRPLSWGARATMRRLCVAMAAFCDPAVPLVRPEMLAWCERLVRECLDITLAEVTLLGDEDDRPDAGTKLLEVLTRAGSDGLAKNELHKVCWAYKRLNTEDRLEVIGRLLADDEITDMNTPRGKRYYARQFVIDQPAGEAAATK